jgi:3'-5' exoribonuclease
MARLPKIAELAPNVSGWGFFLCSRKDARTGRTGSEYLEVVLQDVSGEMRAKVFQDVDALKLEFDAGEFVKAQGRTNTYQGRVELIIDKIRRVMPDRDQAEGFREDECIRTAPRPVDEMWQELLDRIESVSDPALRALLLSIARTHEERLRVWPAARQIHHAYRSGLLEHILRIMEIVDFLAERYEARRDLLIAGALLHDIGKLQELSYDLTTDYTVEGNLVGHIVIGVGMLRDAIREQPGVSPELQTELVHLILSHHGAQALGSPVPPMSVEAFLLAAVDDLDAKLHQVRRHLAEDDSTGPFTSVHRRFERAFLKPRP